MEKEPAPYVSELEKKARDWMRAHLPPGKKFVPNGGCHACQVRPAPGTPFLETPCARCSVAITAGGLTQGHGRNVSFDLIEKCTAAADLESDPVEDALASLTEGEPHTEPAPHAAALPAYSPDETPDDEGGQGYVIRSMLLCPPDSVRVIAFRLAGSSMPMLGVFIARMGLHHRTTHFPTVSMRDAALCLSVALSECPALAHLARTPPDDPDAIEGATPTLAAAFPSLESAQSFALAGFFDRLAALSLKAIATFQRRLSGLPFREIAPHFHETLQASAYRLNFACKTIPELRLLLPGLNGNRARRAQVTGEPLECSAGGTRPDHEPDETQHGETDDETE